MESTKNMRRVVAMALVVMVVFAGQASAGFKSCYAKCAIECLVKTGKVFTCGVQCLKRCIFHSDSTPNPHYYCRLGCSINECATKYTHDPEKMESCVGDCTSNVCTLD